MKPSISEKPITNLQMDLKDYLSKPEHRLGTITSITGSELVTLLLNTTQGTTQCWITPIEGNHYRALSNAIPQAHWFERVLWDMFGLYPDGHPRLKHVLIHNVYPTNFYPLRNRPGVPAETLPDRDFHFLEVSGEGVYEVPVGPIHAGVIEPGHFRCSCLGETILNLEIRLGYVHRGVEKRLTEVPWRKARYVAEAAACDTAVAHALAHTIAMESLLEFEPPTTTQYLRSVALEIERLAVHIIDIGGIATDTGLLGIAQSMSRLRGKALALGEMLAGSRFLRAFICPGGVTKNPAPRLSAMLKAVRELKEDLKPLISIMEENQVLRERCHTAAIPTSLAQEFGLVGVAARAAGIAYDTRQCFLQGIFPKHAPPIALEKDGDVWSRTAVRIAEMWHSIDCIIELIEAISSGPIFKNPPNSLPADATATGIAEAFRGELIHLVFTDGKGKIKRYSIKDPSMNNWTAVSIANRNNLIADFPLCNKSFALAYSGHDL